MKKKKKQGFGKRDPEPERGYTVVGFDGKRPYLPVPGGISKDEAIRLSDGLAKGTRVVPHDSDFIR